MLSVMIMMIVLLIVVTVKPDFVIMNKNGVMTTVSVPTTTAGKESVTSMKSPVLIMIFVLMMTAILRLVASILHETVMTITLALMMIVIRQLDASILQNIAMIMTLVLMMTVIHSLDALTLLLTAVTEMLAPSTLVTLL